MYRMSATTMPSSTSTSLQTTTGPPRGPPPTESPCGMAFDPLGNIYVSYPQSNKIYKQNQLYFPTTSGDIQLNTPMGLCYLNNTLYIADWGYITDWGTSRIVAYNGTTATTIPIPIQPYGLCSIGSILYISGQDSIYSYNNNVLLTLVTQNPGANYMFICTDGVKLYVCDNTTKSVVQINV